jgi:2-keto-4-pentenoate hydratase/2-oxohepta-3-ene-1,7-dioic acid hydratase in catechol pathway
MGAGAMGAGAMGAGAISRISSAAKTAVLKTALQKHKASKTAAAFFIPDFSEKIDYETEIVVRINKLGKNIGERFAHRYYDEIALGIDFTARDLQEKLRSKGLPWDLCKGFDGSAVLGNFINKEELGDVQSLHFHLDIDGQTVQRGYTGDMIFTIDRIISYVSKFFTLKTGDLIYTGTPVGVGPVKEGQFLEGYIEDRKMLEVKIR